MGNAYLLTSAVGENKDIVPTAKHPRPCKEVKRIHLHRCFILADDPVTSLNDIEGTVPFQEGHDSEREMLLF